jgi:hypothetical protein
MATGDVNYPNTGSKVRNPGSAGSEITSIPQMLTRTAVLRSSSVPYSVAVAQTDLDLWVQASAMWLPGVNSDTGTLWRITTLANSSNRFFNRPCCR